jgi:hypothetical protein
MKLKKQIIYFCFILVLGIASFIFSKLNINDVGINSVSGEITTEYFPANTSLKLYYESSMGDAIATIKKVGNNYIMDLRNDDFYFMQTVYFQNDTVYLTKLDQKVDVFLFISSKSIVTYNRPYLRFPFPLNNNDDWEWKGVEYIDNKNPDTIMVSGKVLGEEIIETPAGKFDCVKFQIDIRKKKNGSHTKFYEWRTPKIGLVKLDAFIDSKGFIGKVMKLLGYDEMTFELKKIG